MIVVIIFQIRISPNFKIRSNGIYWDDGGCLSVSSNIYSIFFGDRSRKYDVRLHRHILVKRKHYAVDQQNSTSSTL